MGLLISLAYYVHIEKRSSWKEPRLRLKERAQDHQLPATHSFLCSTLTDVPKHANCSIRGNQFHHTSQYVFLMLPLVPLHRQLLLIVLQIFLRSTASITTCPLPSIRRPYKVLTTNSRGGIKSFSTVFYAYVIHCRPQVGISRQR